jgi:hypothetical protein
VVIGKEEENEEAASSSSFRISAFQLLSTTKPIIISRYDDLILEFGAFGAIFPA